MEECGKKFILVSPGGFGKKKVVHFGEQEFSLDDLISIFGGYNPVKNLTDKDIPRYDHPDTPHYRELEMKYFAYRCLIKNLIFIQEIDREMLNGQMEKEFRLWYYNRFKEDNGRVLIK